MLARAERRLRGDADDAAPAGLAHCRHGGARHQKCAAGVDTHRAVPRLDRHVFDLVAVGALRRPGIVDENVQAPVAAQHLPDHAPGISLDADVAECRRCGSAAAHEVLDKAVDPLPGAVHVALDIVLVGDTRRHDIGDNDGHAGRGERAGGRIADADGLAAAGDQCNAGGTRHVTLPGKFDNGGGAYRPDPTEST